MVEIHQHIERVFFTQNSKSEIVENLKIHHLFKKHFMKEILVLLKLSILNFFEIQTYNLLWCILRYYDE